MNHPNKGRSAVSQSGCILLALGAIASIITTFTLVSGKSDIFEVRRSFGSKPTGEGTASKISDSEVQKLDGSALLEKSSSCFERAENESESMVPFRNAEEIQTDTLSDRIHMFKVEKPGLKRTVLMYDFTEAGQFAVGETNLTAHMRALIRETRELYRSKIKDADYVTFIATQDWNGNHTLCALQNTGKEGNSKWRESCNLRLSKIRAQTAANFVVSIVQEVGIEEAQAFMSSKYSIRGLKVRYMERKRTHSESLITQLISQRGAFIVFDKYPGSDVPVAMFRYRKEAAYRSVVKAMDAIDSCINRKRNNR